MYVSYSFQQSVKETETVCFGKERFLFFQVNSGGIHGIEGYLVQVEADVSEGLPCLNLVGYLSFEVKEAQERVRTAIKNSGFRLPPKKITVNLSPANVRKAGNAFDLPIAVAILGAYGHFSGFAGGDSAFVGELGLNGDVKPVRGTISVVSALMELGVRRFFLPEDNVPEGAAVEGAQVIGVRDLKSLAAGLETGTLFPVSENGGWSRRTGETGLYDVDYREVQGQNLLKRATEVAAAGQHNILYSGPAGSGKSMMAKRIPTILPPLTRREQLEITKIYSVSGYLPGGSPIADTRPFRAPHHSVSARALVGGGTVPRPGEISLASRGVLFLDELAEFKKSVLELLRQPLEERHVTISRLHGAYRYPASFMLAAAMNPCPCGYYPDRERCSCTEYQIRQYKNRLSKPLLDRIDIFAEAAAIDFAEARDLKEQESSGQIRSRVEAAWELQKRRFLGTGLISNRDMDSRQIREYCSLGPAEEDLFQTVYQKLGLSMRGCNRILKVARTIADLDRCRNIQRQHLLEAAGYRGFEM